ncbi:tRNA (cytidine(32)/uridine(32)-2'-O)-methyltransferase [Olavius algarvensis spirochete endosymbiont]|uniref:RNA methyltransferase n=1 Tax=Olavius algarvensis spirochete endosymbiont TaxID=260710 RepID=UPI000F2B49E5|nr:TrmH family RNA methyltransferase [Olavius algarvensis spirochete endosymbiont]VDA99032.1 tRNA (cytidine(32)/uridine(32)-2'-O)-methyltransferase [Olavius algarvensis spirochete endosymbiont]
MNSFLDRLRIILCRPEGALNVGAVCRSMKSMGILELALVNPAEFDEDEVYKMAIHARDVYDGSLVYASLEEALRSVTLAAGITRRRGVRRKWSSVPPEVLAKKIASTASGKCAIVFGNEQSGLSDKELNQCDIACHIPSSPDFPSLNLSHAVQIVAAYLYRESIGDYVGSFTPITRDQIEILVAAIHDALEALNYFKSADRQHTRIFFRDILARSQLSKKEAKQLEKIFRKLPYLRTA